MNTADRSIALIDTALRRRFHFVEMLPDSDLLEGIDVEGINIARMLDTLNERITVLLDREHAIGHSYLLPLKDQPTIDKLAYIFENDIVPLLQEYFYDDYEKIYYLLGDNQKENDEDKFIVRKDDTYGMFGDAVDDLSLLEMYYEINHDAFLKKEAYAYLAS
jgi:5-methylcytosine-specific restriction protein B